MLFVEPKINLFEIEPPGRFVPDFSAVTEQTMHDVISLGRICGPVPGISLNRRYNVAEQRDICWAVFMLESDRLESFLVAPPCTTFSAVACPCLRSYRVPQGFDQHHPRVRLGNIFVFAAITILFVAWRMQKLGLGEQQEIEDEVAPQVAPVRPLWPRAYSAVHTRRNCVLWRCTWL